ncbi:hypothetical protein Cgig2_025731 [Carnegiea gigantea]|uniref:Uncharacterized protein n=1 Tax=Carnegiea gigantea TaxID=171969 RepID=A0A9Q1GLS5_9CARY|nr:hypothetical protein Cgig2_025731 [Carnegiea gigantea]
MVDALKSLMSTLTDAITCQVFEQVRRAMEAANPARPLPHFDHPPVHEGEPSHRLERIPSPRYTERGREVSRSDQSGRPYTEQLGRREAMDSLAAPHRGQLPKVRGHPMLRRPPPMIAPPKPQNARNYCKLHKQSGHTTTECRELKKALHELAYRFLKKGSRLLRREQEPAQPQPRGSHGHNSWGLCGRNNSVILERSTQ